MRLYHYYNSIPLEIIIPIVSPRHRHHRHILFVSGENYLANAHHSGKSDNVGGVSQG